MASYPGAIFPWTNRVDGVNTVFAADPNSLASEIVAVEGVLGTNPQVESAPPAGPSLTYNNVGSRIHDVQMGNQIPVVALNAAPFNVQYSVNQYDIIAHRNSYSKQYDPFGCYNGSDITVPISGWWSFRADQDVAWDEHGFVALYLYIGGLGNNNIAAMDEWDWGFAGNRYPGGCWPAYHPKRMSVTWMGAIQAGTRIEVYTWNATAHQQMQVTRATFKGQWHRTLPPTVTTL